MLKFLTIPFVLLLILTSLPLQAEEKTDQEKMQGTWKLESSERNGQNAPPEVLKNFRVIFNEDQVVIKESEKNDMKFKLKLNASVDPKEIDLTRDNGEQVKNRPGIYKFEKETLVLCFNAEELNNQRPTEFKADKDSKQLIMVMKLVK